MSRGEPGPGAAKEGTAVKRRGGGNDNPERARRMMRGVRFQEREQGGQGGREYDARERAGAKRKTGRVSHGRGGAVLRGLWMLEDGHRIIAMRRTSMYLILVPHFMGILS